VCSADGVTNFYSPCRAGCAAASAAEGGKLNYHECSCVADAWDGEESMGAPDATAGWCEVDCDNVFKAFMIGMFIVMILGSTGRIGNVLVALR